MKMRKGKHKQVLQDYALIPLSSRPAILKIVARVFLTGILDDSSYRLIFYLDKKDEIYHWLRNVVKYEKYSLWN
jgi:hypothetical protein